jgi:hypothetical protein
MCNGCGLAIRSYVAMAEATRFCRGNQAADGSEQPLRPCGGIGRSARLDDGDVLRDAQNRRLSCDE